MAWAWLCESAMSPISDAATLHAGRGRRIVIALVILVLILLPLYLWPLRGGLGAPPWAATLTGSPPKDPRDASALARIPNEVWEALLKEKPAAGSGSAGAHAGHGPWNLTMITQHEPGAGPRMPELGSLDSPPRLLNGDQPSVELLTSAGGVAESPASEGPPPYSAITGSSTPGEFDFFPLAGGGQGNAGPWPSGGGGSGGRPGTDRGVPIVVTDLPFGGDPPSLGAALVLNVGDAVNPVAPHPTPEPSTVALVGLNVVLFCAVAWNHRRYKEVRPRTR